MKPREDHIDAGRKPDWSRTSDDYARHRPGPPPSFYERLRGLTIGTPDQRILDMATGTGALARAFAARGAQVAGTDISTSQLDAARRLAMDAGLDVEFHTDPAEASGLADNSFEIVTACQCWVYFDQAQVMREVTRLLMPGGRLVVAHFSFLPRADEIAAASEALVLRYNPAWGGADWDGEVAVMTLPGAVLQHRFVYDEDIAITRENWRGRMRALRGIGASLAPDVVADFDAAHDEMLRAMAGDPFSIRHRIDAHIFGMDP